MQVSVFEDAFDHVGELFLGQGLQDYGVEMRHVEIAARLDVGGLRDDRDMREPGVSLHRGGEFGAVHLRHPHVRENQVNRLPAEEFQGGLARVGRGYVLESKLVANDSDIASKILSYLFIIVLLEVALLIIAGLYVVISVTSPFLKSKNLEFSSEYCNII